LSALRSIITEILSLARWSIFTLPVECCDYNKFEEGKEEILTKRLLYYTLLITFHIQLNRLTRIRFKYSADQWHCTLNLEIHVGCYMQFQNLQNQYSMFKGSIIVLSL
jgi:hypothetical protein